MIWERYVWIVLILGMVSGICGIAGAVSVGVIAETRITSGAAFPVCTAPCECLTESYAAMTWGAEGYEKCSKTICGQSADADVQYYCIQPVGAAAAPSAEITTASVVVTQVTVAVPVSTAAVPAVPPSSPAAAGTTQKTPVGFPTVLAAIGAAALAAAGMRRH